MQSSGTHQHCALHDRADLIPIASTVVLRIVLCEASVMTMARECHDASCSVVGAGGVLMADLQCYVTGTIAEM